MENITVKCEMPPPNKDRDEKIIKIFNNMMIDELFEQMNQKSNISKDNCK